MSKLRKIGITSIMMASLAASPAAMAEAASGPAHATGRPANRQGSVLAPIISRSLYTKRLEFLADVMDITPAELEAQLKTTAKQG